MNSHTQYDIVVIGAGSGGLTAAVGFRKVGKSVLLIEREHMGGECTNSGCIPSKALLHHAKSYYHATTIAGQSAAGETYRTRAFEYVRDRIDTIRAEETPESFAELGIDVITGEARFTGPCQIEVDDTTYHYCTAIIATGSHPRLLDIPGLEEQQVLTNQNIFNLNTIPERTLVIGAGPIGLELGQALAMLGSQVTIASIDQEFARLEDPAVRSILEAEFTKLGVRIEQSAFIQKVADGVAHFERKTDEQVTDTFTVPFDKVLVAIGRTPNFPAGLETAGIETDPACILVDNQYRTSNKYVYAIGDVAQRLKFTHTADDIARQVVTRVTSYNLLGVNTRKAVPKVTYTMPEVAQVGLSWEAAIAKYGDARLMRIEVPLHASDRAVTENTTEGVLVVIARRLNGAILGAHLVGPAAGEIISIFTLAIDNKISAWKLRSLIYAYPTYNLIVKKAGDYFFARQMQDLRTDLWNATTRHAPKLLALVFWLGLLVAFYQYRTTNDLSYSDVLLNLLDFFTSTLWGPVLYIILYAIRPLILFPATLLTALSGMLFGFWWGILYTLIGENASANFAYWIGHFFGQDLRLEDSAIGNWVAALQARPFGTVLFMRLFYVPFDLTNYGSGILRIHWPSYATATIIGIMPGLITFVALGAALDIEEFRANGISFDAFNPGFLILSVVIFFLSLLLSRYLKRWRASRA
jgi:pyruvate/2-oxoglutarate dehydrogenase complex dihydrolipoamide dehydrogenase (E3) component/uncharacterized membrane protein YdjX (TVP38/TMEM64 family)